MAQQQDTSYTDTNEIEILLEKGREATIFLALAVGDKAGSVHPITKNQK